MWRVLVASLVVVMLVLCNQAQAAESSAASDYILQDLDSNEIPLSTITAVSPCVLLMFWNLDCAPSLDALQKLSALYDDQSDAKYIPTILISFCPEAASDIKSFLVESNYNFAAYINAKCTIACAFNFDELPYFILVNNSQEIILENLGYSDSVASKICQIGKDCAEGKPAESGKPIPKCKGKCG